MDKNYLKLKIVIIFIILLSFSIYGNNSTLKEAYKSYSEKQTNSEFCMVYYNSFPKNFTEFNSIFGYDNVKGAAPLYNESYNYITLFFKCNSCVANKEFLTRLINLSLNGYWDADAIGIFQHNLHEVALINAMNMFEILKGRKDEEIVSFFYFLFDGIHPPFEKVPGEFEKLKEQFPTVYNNLIAGFKNAIKNSGH